MEQTRREQLLFLRNEDYSAAPREHMAAVFQFLGLAPPSADQWAKIAGMEVRNRGKSKRAMLPETRALLEAFYAPFNKRLAAALGDDERWLWAGRGAGSA